VSTEEEKRTDKRSIGHGLTQLAEGLIASTVLTLAFATTIIFWGEPDIHDKLRGATETGVSEDFRVAAEALDQINPGQKTEITIGDKTFNVELAR